MKHLQISKYSRIFARLRRLFLHDALEEIDLLALCSNKKVVVFSSGIPEYRLKRALALHSLGKDGYDWRKDRGCVAMREFPVVEDAVEMFLDDMADAPITVIQDSRWCYRPMSNELYDKVRAADAVIEIDRPHQTSIDILAYEIENGASPERIVDVIEVLERVQQAEGSKIYCPVCDNRDVLIRQLLTKEVLRQLLRPSVTEETRRFVGYLLGLSIPITKSMVEGIIGNIPF